MNCDRVADEVALGRARDNLEANMITVATREEKLSRKGGDEMRKR
jgi:hypothetical protein